MKRFPKSSHDDMNELPYNLKGVQEIERLFENCWVETKDGPPSELLYPALEEVLVKFEEIERKTWSQRMVDRHRKIQENQEKQITELYQMELNMAQCLREMKEMPYEKRGAYPKHQKKILDLALYQKKKKRIKMEREYKQGEKWLEDLIKMQQEYEEKKIK